MTTSASYHTPCRNDRHMRKRRFMDLQCLVVVSERRCCGTLACAVLWSVVTVHLVRVRSLWKPSSLETLCSYTAADMQMCFMWKVASSASSCMLLWASRLCVMSWEWRGMMSQGREPGKEESWVRHGLESICWSILPRNKEGGEMPWVLHLCTRSLVLQVIPNWMARQIGFMAIACKWERKTKTREKSK